METKLQLCEARSGNRCKKKIKRGFKAMMQGFKRGKPVTHAIPIQLKTIAVVEYMAKSAIGIQVDS